MATAKTKRLLTFVLAFMMCFTVYSAVLTARADKVSIGSSQFTSIDNLSFSSTTEGLELSGASKKDCSATYANKLYVGGLSLIFQLTQPNFDDSFTVTLLSYNSDVIGLFKDIEHRLIFTKSDDKLSVKLTTVNFDGTEASSEVKNTGIDVMGKIEISFDSDKTFSIKAAGSNAAAATFTSETAIYKNEANLRFEFKGIVRGKTASAVIASINGQSLIAADSSSNVNDNTSPSLILNTDKFTTDADGNLTANAPANKQYSVPAYGLDVISSNLTYEITAQFRADEDGEWENVASTDKTGLKLHLIKIGEYRITQVKVSDGNGNSTTEFAGGVIVSESKPLIIRPAKWKESNPNKAEDYSPVVDHDSYKTGSEEITMVTVTDTNKYRLKTPVVAFNSAPAGVSQNPADVTYKIMYKEPNSSSATWSEANGLVFTATKTGGPYTLWVQAIDSAGNKSAVPTDPNDYVKIQFIDKSTSKITLSNFPVIKYVDQSVTLPSATITNLLGSSPTRTVKVYYILDEAGSEVFATDEDGNAVYEQDEDGNDILVDGEKVPAKILVSESTTFTPDKKGTYEVVYTATDEQLGYEIVLSDVTFKVEDAPPAPSKPFIDTSNVWTIVFLCIAGASALGIVVLLFVKPKEQD